jgi:hypothetical protein
VFSIFVEKSTAWLLLAAISALALPLAHLQPVSAEPGFWSPKPSVTWRIPITPGPYKDFALCAAVWGNYVFVAGDHNVSGTDTEFMVYKLNKTSGEVIQYWKLNPTNGVDRLYDCIVVGNYLYAIGWDAGNNYQWDIIRFDVTNLNNYIRVTYDYSGWDIPYSVATDGNAIYVAGSVYSGNRWCIRKYDLNLNFKGMSRYDLVGDSRDEAYAIGVNPKTRQVWVVGGAGNDAKSHLKILDTDLNLLKSMDLPVSPQNLVPYAWFYTSIAFDVLGNAYVAVGNTILKLSSDGIIVKQVSLQGNVTKLLPVTDYIYAIVRARVEGKYCSVVQVLNRELQAVGSLLLENGYFRGASFDGSSLYLAGYYSPTATDIDWLIYRIDPLVSRLHLVVRGMSDGIYYRWLTSSWSPWVSLPGSTVDTPAVAEFGDSLLLAVRGRDNGIWYSSIKLSSGEFTGWRSLPGSTPSRPAIAVDAKNSKVYLVVRGGNNGIYYSELGGPGWIQLPGSTIDAPAAAVAGNRLHIVVRGSDGLSIYHGQLDLSTGKWLGRNQIPGSTPSAPSLASNGTHLFLAVRGGDNRVYIKVWSGAWGLWERIPTGSTPSSPSITWYNGKLYVFVRSSTNAIYYCWKTESGQWESWRQLSGSTPSTPAFTAPP